MVETRQWANSPGQLAQLREKITAYAIYVFDNGLLRNHPEAAHKLLRVQLDCIEPPTGEAADLVATAAKRFWEHRIRFVINVLR